MHHVFRAVTAIVVTFMLASSAQADNRMTTMPPATVAPPGAEQRVIAAAGKIDQEDFAGAEADMTALTSEPGFNHLPPSTQAFAWYMLAMAERQLERYPAAMQHLLKGGETDPSIRDYDYWLALSSLGMVNDDPAAAVEGLTQALGSGPNAASDLRMEYVSHVVWRADDMPDHQAAETRLLEALRRAGYESDDPFWETQSLWQKLFVIYVKAGDGVKARALLPDLDDPDFLVSLRVDNRFSAFVGDAAFGGDAAKAFDVYLANLRTKVALHEDLLAGPQTLAFELMRRNRLDEALSVADAAIRKAEAAPKAKPPFSDMDDQLRWLHDTRTRILQRMGRGEEALAAQVKARDISMTQGGDLVSQAINLGDVYNSLGRPTDALVQVKAIIAEPDASPYGLMSAEEVRACAYAQLGQAENLARSMAYMKDHADDGFGPYEAALLCADQGDALAQLIISRLEDPDMRQSTLVDLQTYLAEPHPTPVNVVLAKRMAAVKARPDVQAAVAKYGVIESFPVFAPNT